jgi:putative intracellular protease/amidase
MSRIAIIITDLFEDVEYTQPAMAFQKAGHELVHVGLKPRSVVKGKKKQTPVKIDRAVKDKNLISSRDPGDLPAFVDASLKKLESLNEQPVRARRQRA